MLFRNKINWSLVAKYMAGEADEKERENLSQWLDRSPENRAQFKRIQSDWKLTDTMKTQFNVDNGWNRLHERIAASEQPTANIGRRDAGRKSLRHFLTPVRLAASFLLLALLGTGVVFVANRLQKVRFAAGTAERGKSVVLPDGSTVYFNAGSSLSYTKGFGRKTRDVQLEGEAFFEVVPDKTTPFRVYAHDARIRVLGTSFNVKAPMDDNQVTVWVASGKVELSEAADTENRITLEPGTMGKLHLKDIQAMKVDNKNAIAWKTGNLTFRDTRLLEVTALLNDIYGVNIVLRDTGLDTTRINGNYQDDPLDEILQVICKQTHLTVEKSDNMIYLSR